MAKTAELFSVRTNDAHGFTWKWRSSDGAESRECFAYFYDCVSDAEHAGYVVELGVRSSSDFIGSKQYHLA